MSSFRTIVGNCVCVIGTGPYGLLAIKNLKEQGLIVTAFERNEYIGGLWRPSEDMAQTTLLSTTTKNTSKQLSSFTDFPYPTEVPTHPRAADVESYLKAYAERFALLGNIQFSTEVVRLERDEAENKWSVHIRRRLGQKDTVGVQCFDRVVVASGALNTPNMPKIEGSEKFKGQILHSRHFKNPSKFEGKKVIVVGAGATAADTQSFLSHAKASKVYLSHRGQFMLVSEALFPMLVAPFCVRSRRADRHRKLPRMAGGKASDHAISRRIKAIMFTLCGILPSAMMWVMTWAMVAVRKRTFPALSDHPSFLSPRILDGLPHRVPMFSDDLSENLQSGIVETIPGIARITGPSSLTLTDGLILHDIDAIILCTGYHFDFSLIKKEAGDPLDPEFAPDRYEQLKRAKYYNPDNPCPRLYMGFLSERYPESLAFIGHMLIIGAPFVVSDLTAMALASLWSGAATMPSAEAMAQDIDTHYNFVVRMLWQGQVPHPGFRFANGGQTYRWLNSVAGTGVLERVGCWKWKAWKLWWNDRRFYNLLMDGVDTPFIYRLFDTGKGRKVWGGAKEQIEKTNKEVDAMVKKWKSEKSMPGSDCSSLETL